MKELSAKPRRLCSFMSSGGTVPQSTRLIVRIVKELRLHQPGSSGELTQPRAMRAGLVDTLWSIEDLYAAVMKQHSEKKQRERVENLLRKLRSLD